MSMMNTGDILETIEMFTQDNLDVRTVTMGISLLDCIDPDPKKACEKIYNKITTKAADLVPAVEHISAEYGIPIINKRISVTPIAMLLGACPDADPVDFAKALDAAGKKVGVNFVGGYTALVHKGFSAGDRRLIESIPRALAETDIVCSSVNIGATKAGLNMDAIKLMGEAVKKASELTADRQCIGAAKLVVFCNAPEDNPFMAGAFHGVGEADTVINVGVSGPGVVYHALQGCKGQPFDVVAETIKKTAFQITRMGQMVAAEASARLGVPFGIVDLSLAPTPAVGDSVARILEEMGLSVCGTHGTTAALALLNDAVKKGGVVQQGQRPCGRPVRRLYPRLRGRGHDRRGPGRHPDHRQAGGHDLRVLCGSGHDRRARQYHGGDDLRHHRRRGRRGHGQQQDHRRPHHPRGGRGRGRHRGDGRPAGQRAPDARPRGLQRRLHRPRRPYPRPAAKPEKLI